MDTDILKFQFCAMKSTALPSPLNGRKCTFCVMIAADCPPQVVAIYHSSMGLRRTYLPTHCKRIISNLSKFQASYCPHFFFLKESETQKVSLLQPNSHGLWGVKPGFKPKLFGLVFCLKQTPPSPPLSHEY